MRRSPVLLCTVFCISLTFAQSSASQISASPPKFDMEDVHVSLPTLLGMEGGPMREGRFAMYHATMLARTCL